MTWPPSRSITRVRRWTSTWTRSSATVTGSPSWRSGPGCISTRVASTPSLSLAGEPLNAMKLANLLREHDIRSVDVRRGEKAKKGYRRADLWDAWERYCPDLLPVGQYSPGDPATRATPATAQFSGPEPAAPV